MALFFCLFNYIYLYIYIYTLVEREDLEDRPLTWAASCGKFLANVSHNDYWAAAHCVSVFASAGTDSGE